MVCLSCGQNVSEDKTKALLWASVVAVTKLRVCHHPFNFTSKSRRLFFPVVSPELLHPASLEYYITWFAT